jgi:hypothetical protein
MTTGAAATSRSVSEYTAAATRSNTTPTKNTRRPSRSRSRRARTTRRAIAANNYAATLLSLKRFEEVKSLMRKTVPVARSVLGDSNGDTIRMRAAYAEALYKDDGATLDDVRESVETYEQLARTARRVFGGAHPITEGVGLELLDARAALRAREMPPPSRSISGKDGDLDEAEDA